jgi:hypothetical protein
MSWHEKKKEYFMGSVQALARIYRVTSKKFVVELLSDGMCKAA